MKKIIYILGTILFITSCESRTYDEISNNETITDIVTYNKNVKTIVDANCVVCHSATGSASFQPFTNYNQVKNNIDNILNRIQRLNGDPQKMPQGSSLSANQIDFFIKWKADGLNEN